MELSVNVEVSGAGEMPIAGWSDPNQYQAKDFKIEFLITGETDSWLPPAHLRLVLTLTSSGSI